VGASATIAATMYFFMLCSSFGLLRPQRQQSVRRARRFSQRELGWNGYRRMCLCNL
jgi:hypothetical protein